MINEYTTPVLRILTRLGRGPANFECRRLGGGGEHGDGDEHNYEARDEHEDEQELRAVTAVALQCGMMAARTSAAWKVRVRKL